MSKSVQFQAPAVPEKIDETHYERYADAALLLKCFEIVKDAIDMINEPEYSIEEGDDTHVDLVSAFYALKVLFKRKTGHDAAQVAQQHWDAMSRHLLEGAALPDMTIPLCGPLTSALPPDHFDFHSDLQLACAAFNHSDQVRLGVSATLAANNAQIAATMAIEAINATTALRTLVLRLSGGSMEAMAAHIVRKPGETLQ